SGSTARLAIAAEGAVTVREFTLADPARTVLDVQGATLDSLLLSLYDGLRVDTLRDVRVGQSEVNAMRVLLEFDDLTAFRVLVGSTGFIGITWDASPFGEWRLGRVAASNAATPAPAASVDRIAKSLAAAPSTRVEPAVVRNKTDDPPISVSFENASWPE